MLARTLVKIPAIEAHPLTITLDRAARRLLAHNRTIKALIVTDTTGNKGPATQTDYHLTVTTKKHR